MTGGACDYSGPTRRWAWRGRVEAAEGPEGGECPGGEAGQVGGNVTGVDDDSGGRVAPRAVL